ncbi:alpha-amylase [Cryptococcus neoformans C23]|uniref:alpha-amylase n=2 Tax=Cryptococcus neoformans TaxID=5207 RepID=A0A854QC41_CRYNE|nr:alpha-amylase [Cryptococcus neoformans var. grubii H99]AUB25461.1 alpha-amylase [Cryptococcus neoformans var. grubii]OWZ31039.1 alpha-amylase [Cryptococcus neoformans var. grubii AD2-60a]OWZ41351.1 alpha-amylase [Cryptococcus neoformans var. grubii AD1-83a]OWZ43140.1 alpha-amylase [Cryptococcus neoformans var. grubii C23]OWZ53983.1 alpha-amylase [Cryptococcus neoformans var. grubii 125.91]OXC84221.1 alpha-amylase [Cryptococcus neoformans var. grubii AD1-7a]OXG19885.1 alpha-amylase [Crypto|eukprot:XP_012050001.1 alpha-amylase [Cryptococcus neoformans var. grubii H99]
MLVHQAALALIPLFALLPVYALDADAMRSRSVYQVIVDRFARNSSSTGDCNAADRKYCGGTWSALVDKLDYIQGMGFDTVWISPVVENIGGTTSEGEAYHGYWTLDPDSLNSNFGSAEDLKTLSSSLHARGMYLQVDVVVNHVAATATSNFQPSAAYGPFSASEDYHPFCFITDYNNQTMVEQCWLGDDTVALADLNTENDSVVSYWNKWIKDLVSNYTIDAIRIDTVKHVRHSFWPDFVNAAGVFNQGEVLLGDAPYVASYQKNASINPFNYPMYYPLVRAFNGTGQSFSEFISMVSDINGNFTDPTLLGNFLDNHDNARFESFVTDASLIKNAHAVIFAIDGIPYVYYGSEAGFNGGNDPENREPMWTSNYDTNSDMYKFFTALNAVRSAAGNASSTFYTDKMTVSTPSESTLLVAKKPLMSVFSNSGSSASNTSVSVDSSSSGWAASTNVIDALTCESFTTDGSGNLAVTIYKGEPRVLIEDSQKGSLCGGSSSSPSTSSNESGAGMTTKVGGWVALAGVFVAGLQILL